MSDKPNKKSEIADLRPPRTDPLAEPFKASLRDCPPKKPRRRISTEDPVRRTDSAPPPTGPASDDPAIPDTSGSESDRGDLPQQESATGKVRPPHTGRRPGDRVEPPITPEEKFFDRFKYVALFIVVVGLIAGTAFLVLREPSSERGRDPAPNWKVTDAEGFRQAYLEANGGEDFLRSVHSIRAMGRVESDGTERSFLLVKRVPDQSLFRTETDGGEMSVGTNGSEAWRAFKRDNRFAWAHYLAGEARRRTIQEARFFGGILHHFLFGNGEVKKIEEGKLEDGKTVLWLTLENGASTPDRYAVDPRSMELLCFERSHGGSITRILYSDYRDLDGLRQPFRMETRQNGRTTAVTVLDSAELNPGVLSVLFDKPTTGAPGILQGGWNMAEQVSRDSGPDQAVKPLDQAVKPLPH